jgi:hypothetical protein
MVLANPRLEIDVTEQRPRSLVSASHPSASAKAHNDGTPLARDSFNSLTGRVHR